MIYIEYEEYKNQYLKLQDSFNHFLTEKERLLTKTLPNAIRYDKDNLHTEPDGNPLEDYVIALDEKKIDENLDRIRKLLEDRKLLLECKEMELRSSRNPYDRIYTMRFLNGYGIKRICSEMNYSRAQVYRKLSNIKKKKNMRQNETK